MPAQFGTGVKFGGTRLIALRLALLVVSAFVQIDRILHFIMAEKIKYALPLSCTQIGLITGIAFAACYALLALPLARALGLRIASPGSRIVHPGMERDDDAGRPCHWLLQSGSDEFRRRARRARRSAIRACAHRRGSNPGDRYGFLQTSMRLLSSPGFRWLFVATVVLGFAGAPFYAFAAPFLNPEHGLSTAQAGLIFGLLRGLMGTLVTVVGGQGFDHQVRRRGTTLADLTGHPVHHRERHNNRGTRCA